GNTEVTLSTTSFIYDVDLPTATVTYPSNNGYVSSTGWPAGTVTDTTLGVINNVKVRVSSGAPGSYYFWTGSSWTTTANTWRPATLSPSATAWWLPETPGSTTIGFFVEAFGPDQPGNA